MIRFFLACALAGLSGGLIGHATGNHEIGLAVTIAMWVPIALNGKP